MSTPAPAPGAEDPRRYVARRVDAARARIVAAARAARRDPDAIDLVAVTKGVTPALAAAVVEAGVTDLGENRAQELHDKRSSPELAGRDVRWHFVGRLQRNKIARLAPHVDTWHSVDRSELVPVLARHAPGCRVFVQVNVAAEAVKGGCRPDEAGALVDEVVRAGCRVAGLMTIPPRGIDPNPTFRALAALGRELGLAGLSMGMSEDFESAVAAGATVVRLGRVLFDDHPTAAGTRR